MLQAMCNPAMPATANGASNAAGSGIARSVLDNLAARFRPSGVCLLMLNPDGSLAFHDSCAGLFFQRFALPMVQYPDPANLLADRCRKLTVDSAVEIWNVLPGVVLAAFPYVEKRQLMGVLLLAAKGNTFRLGEDVLRVCSRLGVDGIWLNQQAEELPIYGDEAIQRQARLLLGMIRDQVRLAGLEVELDSLSGQLANTYEELSLIYQLSSGMRINRRAADFFKQACLDVMDVMGVHGMGVALMQPAEQQEPVLYGSLSLPPGKVHRLADQLMKVLCGRKSPLLINNLAADKNF